MDRLMRLGLQLGGDVDGDALCRLLEAIAQEGSLNRAAQRVGISYRHGWSLLKKAEEALGVSLVRRQVGGAAGGGARLTTAGEELLTGYRRLQAEEAGAVRRYFPRLTGAGAADGDPAHPPGTGTAGAAAEEAAPPTHLVLASTIGPVEVGLVPALAEAFLHRTGIAVRYIAVGSGQALAMGRQGRADLLLTHAPEEEEAFIREGYGVERCELMYNDFLLLGPPGDPAGVRGRLDVQKALQALAAAQAPFVSRGDGSGTHLRERALWAAAGVEPSAPWYETYSGGALGSGATLRHAARRRAYTLADRATYLALRAEVTLVPLLEGDPLLRNRFSLIPVRSARFPAAQEAAARNFCRWATGPEGQGLIAGFRPGGSSLFFPAAVGREGGQGRDSLEP